MGIYTNFIQSMSIDEKLSVIYDQELWIKSKINQFVPSSSLDLFNYIDMKNSVDCFSYILRSWNEALAYQYSKMISSENQTSNKRIITIPFGIYTSGNDSFRGIDYLSDDIFLLHYMLKHFIKGFKNEDFYVIAFCHQSLHPHAVYLLNQLKFDAIMIHHDSLSDTLYQLSNKDALMMIYTDTDHQSNQYQLYHERLTYYDTQDQLKASIEAYHEYKVGLDHLEITKAEFKELDDDHVITDINVIDQLVEAILRFIDYAYHNPSEKEKIISDFDKDDYDQRLTLASTYVYQSSQFKETDITKNYVSFIGINDLEKDELNKLVHDHFYNVQGVFKDILNWRNQKEDTSSKKPKGLETVIITFDQDNLLTELSKEHIESLKELYDAGASIILILSPQIEFIGRSWHHYCSFIISTKISSASSLDVIFGIITKKLIAKNLFNHSLTKQKDFLKSNLYHPLEENIYLQFSKLAIRNRHCQFAIYNSWYSQDEVFLKYYLHLVTSSFDKKRVLIGFNHFFIDKNQQQTISFEMDTALLNYYNFDFKNHPYNKCFIEVEYQNHVKLSQRLGHTQIKAKKYREKSIIFGIPLIFINILLILGFLAISIYQFNFIYFALITGLYYIINYQTDLTSKYIQSFFLGLSLLLINLTLSSLFFLLIYLRLEPLYPLALMICFFSFNLFYYREIKVQKSIAIERKLESESFYKGDEETIDLNQTLPPKESTEVDLETSIDDDIEESESINDTFIEKDTLNESIENKDDNEEIIGGTAFEEPKEDIDDIKLKDTLNKLPFAKIKEETVATKLSINKNSDKRTYQSVQEKPISFSEYLFEIRGLLLDRGIDVSQQAINEFMSSIASTHLFLVNESDAQIEFNFIEAISEMVGGKSYQMSLIDNQKHGRSFLDSTSNLMKCIHSANFHPHSIHFILLSHADCEVESELMKKIIDFSQNPQSSTIFIDPSSDTQVEIPKNVWFAMSLDQVEPFQIPDQLYRSSISFASNATMVEAKNEMTKKSFDLSLNDFRHHLVDILSTHYLPESTWKKFDEIDLFMKPFGVEIFDNIISREIEHYTAMYLSCNGLENEVVDNVLNHKILPIAYKVFLSVNHDSELNFYSLCDQLFDLDELKKSKHFLSQIKDINQDKGVS